MVASVLHDAGYLAEARSELNCLNLQLKPQRLLVTPPPFSKKDPQAVSISYPSPQNTLASIDSAMIQDYRAPRALMTV